MEERKETFPRGSLAASQVLRPLSPTQPTRSLPRVKEIQSLPIPGAHRPTRTRSENGLTRLTLSVYTSLSPAFHPGSRDGGKVRRSRPAHRRSRLPASMIRRAQQRRPRPVHWTEGTPFPSVVIPQPSPGNGCESQERNSLLFFRFQHRVVRQWRRSGPPEPRLPGSARAERLGWGGVALRAGPRRHVEVRPWNALIASVPTGAGGSR
jgi:hypothetical protein